MKLSASLIAASPAAMNEVIGGLATQHLSRVQCTLQHSTSCPRALNHLYKSAVHLGVSPLIRTG